MTEPTWNEANVGTLIREFERAGEPAFLISTPHGYFSVEGAQGNTLLVIQGHQLLLSPESAYGLGHALEELLVAQGHIPEVDGETPPPTTAKEVN